MGTKQEREEFRAEVLRAQELVSKILDTSGLKPGAAMLAMARLIGTGARFLGMELDSLLKGVVAAIGDVYGVEVTAVNVGDWPESERGEVDHDSLN